MIIDSYKLQTQLARAGINQSELAKRLGVTRQAVSLYFHQTGVREETAIKIADTLGCDVEDFEGTSKLPKYDPLKICCAMADKGFNTVTLARECGVSPATISAPPSQPSSGSRSLVE